MKENQTDVSNSSTKLNKNASKKPAKAAKTTKAKKPNKVVKFFKDLKSEIKKVVWPTKRTVWNNTGVVLVVMLISGVILTGIDMGFKKVFDLILSRK